MSDLWAILALEGNFELINKLRRAEAGEPGFGTVVIMEKGFSEGTIYGRIVIWKIAWQGFLERPLLGWGPENYSIVFSKYYTVLSIFFCLLSIFLQIF